MVSERLAEPAALLVCPAAMRSALLLPLAAGPEEKLERRPRRSLTWPVVYVVEVDRLGRRFHALVTCSSAGGLTIQPVDRPLMYRRCRAQEVVGHWAKRGRRSTAEPLEPSALELQLDATVRD
jgi:hypothetical protein